MTAFPLPTPSLVASPPTATIEEFNLPARSPVQMLIQVLGKHDLSSPAQIVPEFYYPDFPLAVRAGGSYRNNLGH